MTTPTVASLGATGATLGGNITSDGGGVITARGTCWDTSPTPRTNCTNAGGTATGVFTQARTGFTTGTTYYYAAYATNSVGTGYSEDGTFVADTTLTVTGPASLTYPNTDTITTDSGGLSGGALSYAYVSGGCSVNTSTGLITITNAGDSPCVVNSTRAAGGSYVAQTSANFNVILVKASQAELTITGPASMTYGDADAAIIYTGGTTGGAVTFDAGTSTACSIVAGKLQVVSGTGTCDITATMAGDNNYNLVTSASFAVTINAGSHTVTYDGNGGDGAMSNQTASSPTALTANVFTRVGYTFAGWSTAANGSGTPYADGATYDFSADLTLYAQWAASCVVTNNADSGTSSLRWAIANCPSDSTITFDNNYTITLASELAIAKNLTIDGETHQIVVSGNNITRVFNVTAGNVTFAHLTIANGNVQTTDCGGGDICGGGIMVQNSSVAVTVTNSTLMSNTANFGGGLFNAGGTVMVQTSTLSGNLASQGGGLFNAGGTVTVQTSTLNGNSATSSGGGVYAIQGTVTLENSTLSGNSATGSGSAVTAGGSSSLCVASNVILKNATLAGGSGGSSAVRVTGPACGLLPTLTLSNTLVARGTETYAFNVSAGSIINDGVHNLTTDGSGPNTPAGIAVYADLGLGSLGNYGGTTSTIPLLPGSPAIDAGGSDCLAIDQRGQARNDLRCDSGAYELKYADSPTVIRSVDSATLTTFGPALMGLRRDAGFTDPGTITATKGAWNTLGAESIGAAWRITPTVTSGFSLTLQLCYTDAELGSLTESNLRFWSSDGTLWTASATVPTFTLVNGYHCATLSGLDHLSNWTLATSAPTAVTVRDLTAQSSAPTSWLVAGLIVGAMLATFIGATRLIRRKRITSAQD